LHVRKKMNVDIVLTFVLSSKPVDPDKEP